MLPLLERSQSLQNQDPRSTLGPDNILLEQSLESFHRCISGNSALNHYYPPAIQLGTIFTFIYIFFAFFNFDTAPLDCSSLCQQLLFSQIVI